MNDDNRPDDGDCCPDCATAESECAKCGEPFCDMCFELHDCDVFGGWFALTPAGVAAKEQLLQSEDTAWAREQDEREAIAATRTRTVASDETDDEVLPW